MNTTELATSRKEQLQFLRAYQECRNKMQKVVRDMLEIIADREATEDERAMATATIADVLFPRRHEGKLGLDLAESEQLGASYSGETKAAIKEMDQQEKVFSVNLARIMAKKKVSQVQLAAQIGVGQPAIANMLARQCRPQRRTVTKLAKALRVAPDSLWPNTVTR